MTVPYREALPQSNSECKADGAAASLSGSGWAGTVVGDGIAETAPKSNENRSRKH